MSNKNISFILGKKYIMDEDKDEFIKDFHSRIWISYRYNFIPLLPSYDFSFTSDIGWGCMIRSGQMILAETLLRHKLGRNWRLSKGKNKHYSLAHKDILVYFLDLPNINCDFSIHRIVQLGMQYSRIPGDWYGPETISLILKELVESHKIDISINIAKESIIIEDNLYKLFENNNGLLLLIPLRLGLNEVNKLYRKSLYKFLEFPQSVGFIGGKPGRSIYCVGHDNEDLIYLDPHTPQQTVSNNSYFPNMNELQSYHTSKPLYMNYKQLDPSLVVGFYINNKNDLEDFFIRLNILFSNNNPLFEIIKNQEDYDKINQKKSNCIVLSTEEEDDWELIG